MPEQDEDGRHILPGMIGVGDAGHAILVSREMDRIIFGIARLMKQNSASLDRTHTDAEWIATVRRALGPILVTIDLDGDPRQNGKTVIDALRHAIKPETTPDAQYEHAFGCTLFSVFDLPPFSIGPVTLEPRLTWLGRGSSRPRTVLNEHTQKARGG